MALAGNCGYGALARVGGGDLRSILIILVMGISAYVTLSGPLSGLRIVIFGETTEAEAGQTFAHSVAVISGFGLNTVGISIGLAIVALTLILQSLRKAPSFIFWDAIAGLAIAPSRAGSQWLASNDFDATPVVSRTVSAPIGETMLYLMTSSGNAISFGAGSVAGVLVGSFLGGLYKGLFRWETCDDLRELRRQILVAVLMGVGAVVAVGCSVGQGLSAFSVLTFSAPVTLACIMIGASMETHSLGIFRALLLLA